MQRLHCLADRGGRAAAQAGHCVRSIFDGRVRVAAASVGDWGSFLQLFSSSGGANEMRAARLEYESCTCQRRANIGAIAGIAAGCPSAEMNPSLKKKSAKRVLNTAREAIEATLSPLCKTQQATNKRPVLSRCIVDLRVDIITAPRRCATGWGSAVHRVIPNRLRRP